MKLKKILFFAFALIIVLVPIYVIVSSQDILSNGTFYKFKQQAYDPFDPFRGQYLRINYDTRDVPTSEDFEENDEVFVSIGVDKEGFAFFKEAYKTAPEKGDYLVSKVSYVNSMVEINEALENIENRMDEEEVKTDPKKLVSIDIPDNMCKYFINEDYAKKAEEVLQEQQDDIYIGIRIKNGASRLQDIFVKDKPLTEYLRKK